MLMSLFSYYESVTKCRRGTRYVDLTDRSSKGTPIVLTLKRSMKNDKMKITYPTTENADMIQTSDVIGNVSTFQGKVRNLFIVLNVTRILLNCILPSTS